MDAYQMFLGTIAISIGIPAMIWPGKARAKQEAARLARISQLDAGSDENYFEERRALDAYPGPGSKSDRRMRIFGIFMSACGSMLLARAFTN